MFQGRFRRILNHDGAGIVRSCHERGGHRRSDADFRLAPTLGGRQRCVVLAKVSNRGRNGMLAMYNRATASHDPKTAAEFGDNFLLERGYTLIWLGWQFDVPRTQGLMRLYTPIARNGDRPITGLVRAEGGPSRSPGVDRLMAGWVSGPGGCFRSGAGAAGQPRPGALR